MSWVDDILSLSISLRSWLFGPGHESGVDRFEGWVLVLKTMKMLGKETWKQIS
ncbi:uncharacterized protein H6S33_000849 [Morchella sextelata]|uniref:uncharacterized protein n=1 Tax=Morchella sextelata TaxID=1174677 RepID=UPI001D05053B|nr:uncharacterized protein H6S33_000849 [Morchella sextelata]KAH0615213.1 hypothetical protein H6S33_000849 [Morchella sextelata]